PAGLVQVTADCVAGRCQRLTFENVPSFATQLGVPVDVPGVGRLHVDIAYGGAWVAFVDVEPLGYALVPSEARAIAELGERIRPHVVRAVKISHPTVPALRHLSFVVLTAPARDGGNGRNATVVSPGRLDRSPTGTATSARLAVLTARGLLRIGDSFVNESIISTKFVGRIVAKIQIGPYEAIIPSITGRSWITGFHQIVV